MHSSTNNRLQARRGGAEHRTPRSEYPHPTDKGDAMTSPTQLAAYCRAGDRAAYVRAWYCDLRSTGCTARTAHALAANFWRLNIRGLK